MNPKRSVLSSSTFSFGFDTEVLFKTVFDHYRIGTPRSLMTVDAFGDESGLLISDEQVQCWAQLPTVDDVRWKVAIKPFDEPLLVLYRNDDGAYRYVVQYRVFKNRSQAIPIKSQPCCGWMYAESVFQRDYVADDRFADIRSSTNNGLATYPAR